MAPSQPSNNNLPGTEKVLQLPVYSPVMLPTLCAQQCFSTSAHRHWESLKSHFLDGFTNVELPSVKNSGGKGSQISLFGGVCVSVRVFDGDSSGREQNGQDGDVTALLR